MTIEDVWSWKHSIPLAIIMAFFATRFDYSDLTTIGKKGINFGLCDSGRFDAFR